MSGYVCSGRLVIVSHDFYNANLYTSRRIGIFTATHELKYNEDWNPGLDFTKILKLLPVISKNFVIKLAFHYKINGK